MSQTYTFTYVESYIQIRFKQAHSLFNTQRVKPRITIQLTHTTIVIIGLSLEQIRHTCVLFFHYTTLITTYIVLKAKFSAIIYIIKHIYSCCVWLKGSELRATRLVRNCIVCIDSSFPSLCIMGFQYILYHPVSPISDS